MQQIRDEKHNGTSVSEFLLKETTEHRGLQLLHFYAFLILYLIAVTGNLLVIMAVALDDHLRTAMYFFLMNLAIMDVGTISVTMPKSMGNALTNTQLISYAGCVAQVFFFIFFQASGFALLTIMAYDRYVAICNPLRYEMKMNPAACIKMATIAWFAGLLHSAINTSTAFAITFCSNIVNQFFCDMPKIHILSCSDNDLVEVTVLAFDLIVILLCFIFIIVSYVQIFTAVLRMTSVQGRQKAFSTCIPHLIIVSLFIFSGATAYLSPSNSSSELDLVFAFLYAVVPPMINPFIYSMRNKEVKIALWKFISLKYFSKAPHVRFVS